MATAISKSKPSDGAAESAADETPPRFKAFQDVIDAPVLWCVDNLEIEEELPYAVMQQLAGRHFERLAVVLTSHGGSATAAYKAAVQLRRAVDPGGLAFFLPAHAESAATLMTLVADVIVMSPVASLSALDIQVLEDQAGGSSALVSSLCLADGLEAIGGWAVRFQGMAASEITKNTSLTTAEVVRLAGEVATGLMQPVMAHVDPEVVGARQRSKRLARDLGRKLMDLADVIPEERRDAILDELVTGRSAHAWPLMMEEAMELGLPATGADGAVATALADLAFLRDWDEWRFLRLEDPNATDRFDVIVTGVGDSRVKVAAALRSCSRLELDVAESLRWLSTLPAYVDLGLPQAEAEAMRTCLEAAGATVLIQPSHPDDETDADSGDSGDSEEAVR